MHKRLHHLKNQKVKRDFAATSGSSGKCFCNNCGIVLSNITRTLDHIWPLSKNGINHETNYQWLCKPCNLAKGSELPTKGQMIYLKIKVIEALTAIEEKAETDFQRRKELILNSHNNKNKGLKSYVKKINNFKNILFSKKRVIALINFYALICKGIAK